MKEQYIISKNVEEQIKVLQILEKLGYLWPTKKKPTKLVPLKESIDEYANVIYMELDNKIITHSDEEYLSELKTKI